MVNSCLFHSIMPDCVCKFLINSVKSHGKWLRCSRLHICSFHLNPMRRWGQCRAAETSTRHKNRESELDTWVKYKQIPSSREHCFAPVPLPASGRSTPPEFIRGYKCHLRQRQGLQGFPASNHRPNWRVFKTQVINLCELWMCCFVSEKRVRGLSALGGWLFIEVGETGVYCTFSRLISVFR